MVKLISIKKFVRSREYPNLNRLAKALVINRGNRKDSYFVSEKAVPILEQNPSILLHLKINDLLNPLESPLFLVEDDKVPLLMCCPKDQPRCAVSVRNYSMIKSKVNFFAEDEIEGGKFCQQIEIPADYPQPLLPFDLYRLSFWAETECIQRPKDQKTNGELQMFSDPFAVYHDFYTILAAAKNGDEVAERIIDKTKTMLEIGGGIGLLSLLISQFLPKTSITSVEIDKFVKDLADKIQLNLSGLGYDVANVSFVHGDATKVDGNYDAMIGWFPISTKITTDDLLSLFGQVSPGGFVFKYDIYRSIIRQNDTPSFIPSFITGLRHFDISEHV